MNKTFPLFLLLILLVLGVVVFQRMSPQTKSTEQPNTPSPTLSSNITNNTENAEQVKTFATNLDTPWSIVFLPDGNLFVTERPGRVRFVDKNGAVDPTPVATIAKVKEIGEGGLLGITIHPNFSSNNYVYLYYTYGGSGDNTLNRVVRMTYKDKKLTAEQIIVDKIPGAPNHNGGRIKFGPDNYLYITTGDAQNPSLAQNKNSLAGKILRVTDEGKAAPGNPFNNLVYSYGHRNPQGITWSDNGNLYEVEHGSSATDEFNYIEPGKNYGWPTVKGDETRQGLTPPVIQSDSDTWAPGGAAFFNGSVYFTGLRGQALYQAVLSGDSATLKTHFKGEFGRLRDVVVGPDGLLYISTSNRDGRGNPAEGDDKILRVNPRKL